MSTLPQHGWLGIDPGLDGAFALLLDNGETSFIDMPVDEIKKGKSKNRLLNIQGAIEIIKNSYPMAMRISIAIERQQSMPKQGVASTFQTGFGYGVLLGVLTHAQVPFEIVQAKAWKGSLLAGMPEGKGASIVKAKQLFPLASKHLTRVKDHGRADALLIAEFCRRKHAGVV